MDLDMALDMALRGSTGQDLTLALGATAGHSHQAVSGGRLSSLCPHPLFLFLFHIKQHLLVPLSGAQSLLNDWGHLRSGLRISVPCLCIVAPGRGHLSHGLP